MKRNIALLTASVLLLTLAGCSRQEQLTPPGEVVGTMEGEPMLKYPLTLERLITESTVIADVEIGDMEYTSVGVNPCLHVTLSVNETFMGEPQPGDTFQAYLPGGYISVADYEEALGERVFHEVPEEERGSSYLYFPYKYQEFPKPGDRLLVFLGEGQPAFPDGLYAAYGYTESVFTCQDGKYISNSAMPDLTREEIAQALEASADTT